MQTASMHFSVSLAAGHVEVRLISSLSWLQLSASQSLTAFLARTSAAALRAQVLSTQTGQQNADTFLLSRQWYNTQVDGAFLPTVGLQAEAALLTLNSAVFLISSVNFTGIVLL